MKGRSPSTRRLLCDSAPAVDPSRVVGRHLLVPRCDGRKSDGGLRTEGRFKASRPGLPLVSIVTVCLNAARTIGQAMASVFGQTYDNIEYIVVDGASTDGTVDMLEAQAAQIDYFVSERDGGLYEAMNKGLGLATGDFVLVLNSDDWYVEEAVARLVRAQGYSGSDFVSSLAQYVDDDGLPVRVMRSIPFDAGMRFRMPLRHETMLLSAALYNRYGPYDTRYRIVADFALAVRLFDAGVTHYEIPEPLLFFRMTGVSSTNTAKLFEERRRLIAEQMPELTASDLDALEEIGTMRPHQVLEIAQRHPDSQRLHESLKALEIDQSRRPDALAWSRAPLDWRPLDAMLGRPKVSVVLPFHAAEETIGEAIESVLAQTFREFELLCIDDTSRDGSRAIVERFSARDPRVRLLANAANLGHGGSRNRGVDAARGAYVFHLDPDDMLPPGALAGLYAVAIAHRSQMVKGAYDRSQSLHGQAQRRERVSLAERLGPLVNTSLACTPELLQTTEGHWSYLWETEFARQVRYPVDLKMGQDSIFMCRALARAKAVTLTDVDAYIYRVNPASAMNSFNYRKFHDALEWRRRAWHVLNDHGFRFVGDRLLTSFWGPEFFSSLAARVSDEQMREFLLLFRRALGEAGLDAPTAGGPALLGSLLPAIAAGDDVAAMALMRGGAASAATDADRADPPEPGPRRNGSRPIRVVTLCSLDHGGAGTGSQRRVAALRHAGLDVQIHTLVKKSTHAYVRQITAMRPGIDHADQAAVWRAVQEQAMKPLRKHPGYRASELFSGTASVVDFRQMEPTFRSADVVHLHWVVALLDYEHVEAGLAQRPVVWTLADMNAFTGGCHYSEGCDGYERECRKCPLLGGDSDVAHEAWKLKQAAYARIPNLHIICPSRWMAQRVARSSLLGDRPIHYIPNAFPIDRFAPTNKTVARVRLGLPLHRKLLLFGADSVDNKRKGGIQLRECLERLAASGSAREGDVEVVLFGHRSLDLPLRSHSMGHVADDSRLALIYSAADVYVFPSLEDNAPLTVGEALLCGTPVVAFPVGNVPDVVRHRETGYIARYRDAEDLADGIRWAIEVEARAALRRSLQCRMHAAQMHAPHVAAERHVEVYRQAIGQSLDEKTAGTPSGPPRSQVSAGVPE